MHNSFTTFHESARPSALRHRLTQSRAPADEPHQEEQFSEGRDKEEAEVDPWQEIVARFHDDPACSVDREHDPEPLGNVARAIHEPAQYHEVHAEDDQA